MPKTLQKTGNSYAAIIPKEVLSAVGATVDSPYELRVVGEGRIELRFDMPPEEERRFIEKVLQKSFKRHGDDYTALAK